MLNTDNTTKISRDEINEAMARFFSNGGKINKIELWHNSISSHDPLSNEGNEMVGNEILSISSGSSLPDAGRW